MKILKVLGGIGVVLISFLGTLWVLGPINPCDDIGIDLRPPFKALTGFSYVAPAPPLEKFTDTPDAPTRSNVLFCENDTPLGPAHAAHGEIANIGTGRFSHWNGMGFIFSSSDNSDPNKNGKRYKAVPGSM